MRASEQVAEMERDLEALRAENAALKGQLIAGGLLAIELAPWMDGLTPPQIALMTALVGAYPRILSRDDIEERVLPKRDHGAVRDPKIVDVQVCNIRKVLGKPAVENVFGVGFRCGAEFHRIVRGTT